MFTRRNFFSLVGAALLGPKIQTRVVPKVDILELLNERIAEANREMSRKFAEEFFKPNPLSMYLQTGSPVIESGSIDYRVPLTYNNCISEGNRCG